MKSCTWGCEVSYLTKFSCTSRYVSFWKNKS